MNEKKEMMLSRQDVRENSLIKNVYLWMTLGLALTAAVSYLVSMSPSLLKVFTQNIGGSLLLVCAQFGLVIFLSSRIEKMQAQSAIIAFCAYAVPFRTFLGLYRKRACPSLHLDGFDVRRHVGLCHGNKTKSFRLG